MPPIDGTSAPAEVSMSIRQDSSLEIHHALEAARQHMQAAYGFVKIQILNEGYVEFTKSWMCNVRTFPDVLAGTLFITTDLFAYHELQELNPQLCVVLELHSSPAELTYGKYACYNFMLFRTALILQILRTGAKLWLTVSDLVWFTDLPVKSHPAVVLNNWIAGNAAKKKRAKT